MYYTYILKSLKTRGAIYIGYTADLKSRLIEHNQSIGNHQDNKYKPWVIETYIAFSKIDDAKSLERYLKSNSGKAFLRKRLISNQFREALKRFNNGRGQKVSET